MKIYHKLYLGGSFFILLSLFGFRAFASAGLILPAIFSDHAVLQSDVMVPVWGWADPGEQITVMIAGQTKSTTTGTNGKWRLDLEKIKTGGPFTLTVRGNKTIIIKDVLVGEVWLCAGQSNMRMQVSMANNAKQEQAAADFPRIRLFLESSGPATIIQERCHGRWEVCSTDTVKDFSATAYFFGRQIYKALGVPVGLIHSSVAGTPIEAWTSMEAQKNSPELKPVLERWEQIANTHPPTQYPGHLFNSKIATLIPYAIRGTIWYQGEFNANPYVPLDMSRLYGLQLETMIIDWRTRWGQGDFPFCWVQLPGFHRRQRAPVETNSGWALVREGMLKALSLPNTGMAVAVDLGDAKDLHPKNKQDIGKRLAAWALAKVYRKNIPAYGPLPSGYEIHGNEVVISFSYVDGGLIAKNDELKGFAISGNNKKWVKAKARIEGDKVVLSSDKVRNPISVSCGWADNPDCNLYNGAGFPASPFRIYISKNEKN